MSAGSRYRLLAAAVIVLVALQAGLCGASRAAQSVIELPVPGAAPLRLGPQHPLIEWIEMRLGQALANQSLEGLDDRLNADLVNSHACRQDASRKDRCDETALDEFNVEKDVEIGNLFVEQISKTANYAIVLVTIDYSVKCGGTKAAYFYKWWPRYRRLQRVWSLPPQGGGQLSWVWNGLWEVSVSYSAGLGSGAPGLIVAAGDDVHCNSTWEYGRYRIWQVDGAFHRVRMAVDETRTTNIDWPNSAIGEVNGSNVEIKWAEKQCPYSILPI